MKHAALRLKWQNEGREKAKERDWLHVAGCMLYWGEGRKGRNICSLSNSDPSALKFFLKFLKSYFEIDNERISVNISVHLNNGKK